MKKVFLLLFCLTITSISINGQTAEQLEQVKKIEGTYQLDNDFGYSYVRVFEDLNANKEELYNRALSFFPYLVTGTYDARKIIQHEDKEEGIVVAKVAHNALATRSNLAHYYEVAATPIWRIDIKENRLRLIISNKNWTLFHRDSSGILVTEKTEEIPTTKVGPFQKTKPKMDKMYTHAFLRVHVTVEEIMKKFEEHLRKGSAIQENLNEDW